MFTPRTRNGIGFRIFGMPIVSCFFTFDTDLWWVNRLWVIEAVYTEAVVNLIKIVVYLVTWKFRECALIYVKFKRADFCVCQLKSRLRRYLTLDTKWSQNTYLLQLSMYVNHYDKKRYGKSFQLARPDCYRYHYLTFLCRFWCFVIWCCETHV